MKISQKRNHHKRHFPTITTKKCTKTAISHLLARFLQAIITTKTAPFQRKLSCKKRIGLP